MKSQLINLAKLSSAFLLFFLLSNTAMAQTAVVNNFNSCDMVVKIYGTDDCGTVACTQTANVTAGGSATITLTCGSNVVYAEITSPCSSSMTLELATPLCYCGGGSNTDNDTFTMGAFTASAMSTCSGSSIAVDIY